jgi:hypothetical protein
MWRSVTYVIYQSLIRFLAMFNIVHDTVYHTIYTIYHSLEMICPLPLLSLTHWPEVARSSGGRSAELRNRASVRNSYISINICCTVHNVNSQMGEEKWAFHWR